MFAYDSEVVKYLENNIDFSNGIYVVKIMSDGPLAKTNIKIGDIITEIDGNNVSRMSELRRYIYSKNPGDTVKLTIERNKKEYQINVILSKR